MRFHDRIMIPNFSAALPEVPNQFFATIELRASWLITIEITDQTNSERDVVQIITVNMAAVDLPAPAVSHFNLSIAGRSAVADHKMIGEPILHAAKMAMVIIERGGVALTSATVMDHDVLPATACHWGAIDLAAN